MKTLTSVEAQSRFGELLDTAQREPVTITRRGRTVAIILSPQDLADLIEGRQLRQQAAAAYDAYRARVAQQTGDTDQLTDEQVNRLVHELR
jgi:prevent-host-death family protein